MHKNGRYYLGRIVKIGHFTQEMLLKAMRAPVTKSTGKYGWTIIEGACRHIVAQRTKLSGMRWLCSGAENVLAFRCRAHGSSVGVFPQD